MTRQSRYDEPPEWAKDPFNPGQVYRCECCGEWEEVVRPGKTQPTCDCQRERAGPLSSDVLSKAD
jgi:hypothetical protein